MKIAPVNTYLNNGNDMKYDLFNVLLYETRHALVRLAQGLLSVAHIQMCTQKARSGILNIQLYRLCILFDNNSNNETVHQSLESAFSFLKYIKHRLQ